MIVIHKGNQPHELLVNKQQGIKRYEDLHKLTLDAIRVNLFTEQGGLCAYCMRRISLDHKIKIEHYDARNPEDGFRDDSVTIDFRNMLLVCDGNEGAPLSYQTCDSHRRNQRLIINPFSETSVSKVSYKMDGRIYSDDPEINNDLDDKLNLNCFAVSLKENRKAALTSLQKQINIDMKRKHATPEYWSRLYQKVEYIYPKAEYLGILLWYIKRRM
jgi:uncharacterized protein (TIGR02646 family)